TLVIDVCSVKVHPVRVMQEFLPAGVDILATHPMFGPDSSDNGANFTGLRFVYAPIRVKNQARVDWFLNFWRTLECRLIELSPDEHDRQAAYSQAFAFLVGKVGHEMKLTETQIATQGFLELFHNQQVVGRDSWQLFRDMFSYNPYTKEM